MKANSLSTFNLDDLHQKKQRFISIVKLLCNNLITLKVAWPFLIGEIVLKHSDLLCKSDI